ncbi:MAG: molybdopterin biosynthesis protein [Lachnospiraceae bacterium]|nr:molybdopterin biosynthesis protein [Lachnospiraceae bacterium]
MPKRNLYLHTISVEEAYNKYFDALKEKNILSNQVEEVKTVDALNRITSEAIYARCNSPLFNAASMDGICVDSKITKNASEENPIILKLGVDYKIVDTGDAIKPPFDAVIMAEDVIEIDEETVKIVSPISGWENIRPIGEDIVIGEMILESNHEIKPIDIGALIAGGISKIKCHKKMTVGIIPTGDEIVNMKDEPKEGDIIDSNSYMIKALVEASYGIGNRYDIVKDDYEKIKSKLKESIKNNDVTIINAGSSAGTEDYTVHILREIGEVIVHGVSMKPGKPVILAIVDGKPVIGLPGYPMSAYLAFDLFVKPILTRKKEVNEEIDAVSSKRLISSLKHREFVRVKVGKIDDKYVAAPLNRGAASQMSMVKADGIMIIPQNSEGVEAGELCKVKLLKNKSAIDNTLISIGSHDILMDIVSDIIARNSDSVTLSSTHVGSMGGLLALKRNETIIAPTHLLDENTGVYNISILKELFGEGKVSLIKGFNRIQGLMVKKGNPLNIKGIEDLTKCRFVNRQRGAGTRVLLDYKLKKLGIDQSLIDGYDKELSTHMAVAASVKSPYSDCGMGVKSAADSMGLDFIEVGVEEYDFAIYTKNLEDKKVQYFLETIKSQELHDKLVELGGYGFEHVGQIINI